VAKEKRKAKYTTATFTNVGMVSHLLR
jgi:hypothetical protein